MPDKYSHTLLNTNSQFSSHDPRLNHEAISLLLKHSLKNQHPQTFVLAGSEDLRALLPRLQLEQEGSEVFILMRPYVHCMAIYLRRAKDKTQCFIFDSQNWGVRYYPTRNMLHALVSQPEDVEIIFSGTEVQSQNNQVGCIYYSLQVLEFCAQNGANLLNHIAQYDKTALPNYPKTSQLIDGSLPPELLANLTQDNFVTAQHQKRLQELESILGTHYLTNDGQLDFDKIEIVVREMQGYDLPELDHSLNNPPLYDIHVDSRANQVTIHLQNKDWLTYNNAFIFSSAIYPIAVSIDRSQLLFGNNPDIRVEVNTTNHSLTYQARDLKTLEQAFTALPAMRKDLFAQQMRQQVGLQGIAAAVQEEIDLSLIKRNYFGGLDQRQVQYALAYLFKNNNKVYVPRFDELAGEHATLPLSALKKQGYQYIAFSFDADTTHQVAVWVELKDDKYQVTVYDSLYRNDIPSENRLKQLFGEYQDKCVIEMGVSPYLTQTDDWSCGIYVIAHLHSKLLDKMVLDQQEPLDINLLARRYYRASKRQEKQEAIVLRQGEHNDSLKRILLRVLANAQSQYPGLTDLTNFLHIELWGNLTRDATRKNQSDEYRRTRPIHLTIKEYTHWKDPIGLLILQLAEIFQGEQTEFERHLQQMIQKVMVEKSEDEPGRNLALAIYADIVSTMNYQCKSVDEQHGFMRELILKLLNENEAKENLTAFFIHIDCEYYSVNQDFRSQTSERYHFIQFFLLARLIITTLDLESNLSSKRRRIIKEQSTQEIEEAEKRIKTKKLLQDLGVPEQPETFYLALSNNRLVLGFIENFVDDLYFAGVDALGKVAFLNKLNSEKFDLNHIIMAIRLYPGNNLPGYLQALKSKHPISREAFLDAAGTENLELLQTYIVLNGDNADAINAEDSQGDTTLIRAVRGNRVAVVKVLLAAPNINVNAQNHGGLTALIEAANLGSFYSGGANAIFDALLAAPGIDINKNTGITALIRAAKFGRAHAVKALLATPGIQVNAQDRDGNTALISAGGNGYTAIVVDLLAAPGINLNIANKKGDTAFICAVRDRYVAAEKLLAARGINVNIANNHGKTALMYAITEGYTNAVEDLINFPGIDTKAVNKEGDNALMLAIRSRSKFVTPLLAISDIDVINAANTFGDTPLLLAVRDCDGEIIKALLAIPNIDVNAMNEDRINALMQAVLNEDFDTVKDLLALPNIDVNAVNPSGETALMIAIKNYCVDIAKVLVAAPGIKVNIQNRMGYTALTCAIQANLKGIVDDLLTIPDIDINSAASRGDTPLLLAVQLQRVDIIESLLRMPRVNANAVTMNNGETALIMAIDCCLEVVPLLLNVPDLNVNMANNKGHTALMHVAMKNRKTIVYDLLKMPGIDVNAVDSEGNTALILAVKHCHIDIIKALLTVPGIDLNARNKWGETALTLASFRTDFRLLFAAATSASTHMSSREGLVKENSDTPKEKKIESPSDRKSKFEIIENYIPLKTNTNELNNILTPVDKIIDAMNLIKEEPSLSLSSFGFFANNMINLHLEKTNTESKINLHLEKTNNYIEKIYKSHDLPPFMRRYKYGKW